MTTTRFNIEESPSGRFCSFRNMLAAEPKQGDEDAKDNVIRAQTRALILEAYKAAYQVRRVIVLNVLLSFLRSPVQRAVL